MKRPLSTLAVLLLLFTTVAGCRAGVKHRPSALESPRTRPEPQSATSNSDEILGSWEFTSNSAPEYLRRPGTEGGLYAVFLEDGTGGLCVEGGGTVLGDAFRYSMIDNIVLIQCEQGQTHRWRFEVVNDERRLVTLDGSETAILRQGKDSTMARYLEEQVEEYWKKAKSQKAEAK